MQAWITKLKNDDEKMMMNSTYKICEVREHTKYLFLKEMQCKTSSKKLQGESNEPLSESLKLEIRINGIQRSFNKDQ